MRGYLLGALVGAGVVLACRRELTWWCNLWHASLTIRAVKAELRRIEARKG